MKFAVKAVKPTGERTGPVFVTRDGGCSYENITTKVYPPHAQGEELRRLRVSRGVGLRACCDLLGLTPTEVSGLEFGRYTFVNGKDWDRAFEAIRERVPTAEAKETTK